MTEDIYLIIVAPARGERYIPETNLPDTTFKKVLQTLIDRQHEAHGSKVDSVLKFNLDGSPSSDVSEDLAIAWWKILRGTVDFEDLPDFVITHFPYTDDLQACVWEPAMTYKEAMQTRNALSRLGLCEPQLSELIEERT